ncbi:MAG: hypothetical protein ABIZ80_14770 [Bryobacteraceae bacterium]
MNVLPGLLLGVLLTAVGCSETQTAGGRIDAVLASLVPADTIVLSGVEMETLRTTPTYQKILAQKGLREIDEFAARTKFDPRKDVREILAVSDGTSTVILARGNFRPGPIKGVQQTKYKGWTLYGKGEGAFALLDATTAAAGPEAAVKKLIDHKSTAPAALFDRVKALPAGGQIWAVSAGWGNLVDRFGPKEGNGANLGRVFRSLENTTVVADLRNGLEAQIDGLAKTDQDAKTLGDAVRGMVGLGRLSVPENRPEMLRIFDGIKVEQQQKSIRIRMKIGQGLVDQLIALGGR